jgi:hypothetical protein
VFTSCNNFHFKAARTEVAFTSTYPQPAARAHAETKIDSERPALCMVGHHDDGRTTLAGSSNEASSLREGKCRAKSKNEELDAVKQLQGNFEPLAARVGREEYATKIHPHLAHRHGARVADAEHATPMPLGTRSCSEAES